MKRVLLCLLMALLPALPVHAEATLGEAWVRVQQALANPTVELLQQRVSELKRAAADVDAVRLTPYARSLVAWAEAHHDETGRAALELAATLDPDLPSVRFVQARWAWRAGAYRRAVSSYLSGWGAMMRAAPARRFMVISLTLWGLLTLAIVLLAGVILQTARFLPELGHDAAELGQQLFARSNAIVFAIVVLALPLFAGLGPIWLLGYLFGLSWVYMSRAHRVTAAVVWILLVCLVPAAELWQDLELRKSSPLQAAGAMLAERRVDPAALQDFANLEAYLQDEEGFHLILGELLRLHGDIAGARLQYQKASLLAPRDPVPRVFLGNLAFEDGNVGRAVQEYSAATEMAPGYGLAFYDLSAAYDRTYRFQEADVARTKANNLGSTLPEAEGAVANSGVLYPRLGMADVAVLRQAVPPRTLMAAGLAGPAGGSLVWFLGPFPLAFLATGLVGLVTFFLRRRFMWTARACTRCGKVFCSRCKSATESDSYCSQCISVFLKRDVVPIEQQSAKMDRIRRWERWGAFTRRGASMLLPGGGLMLSGRWVRGLLMATVAVLLAVGALVWIPYFVRFFEPEAAILPLQAIFLTGVAALWVRSLLLTWNRR